MWDLTKFSQMEDLFMGAVKFQPRIAIQDCRWCSAAIKKKQCIFDGKYCPYKPYSVINKALVKEEITPLDLINQALNE